MLRKIILAVLGIIMIAGAVMVAKNTLANKKQRKPKPAQKIVTGVYIDHVENGNTPITITTSGNLTAKNRLELFAEVQGIFIRSSRPFKPGTWFKKGETLLELDKKEEIIGLKAQKSSFYNQLVLLIPDLKLDYPDAVGKWEEYVRQYDVNHPLGELPETETEKEKLFLSGRNIYTAYYNVQNLEVQLTNYTIRAPFSGVLTEALADPGTLVRPGQKLGEFINTGVYELEVAINTAYGDLLGVGKTVVLHNIERTKKWKGKVVRVNSLVDPTSQTIPTFIQLSGEGLKEGMYLEADVTAKEEADTYELNRKLLVENDKLFIVRDSVLDLIQIEPIFFKDDAVVVKGLPNGTALVTKAIPGAYVGMPVKIFTKEAVLQD